MTQQPVDLKQVPSRLTLYIQDAEILIKLASESVRSFFVSKEDYQNASVDFIGFLQDSLVGEKEFRVSTGGLSVAADLYQAEPYLQYLGQNKITEITELRQQRDDSRAYIMEVADSQSLNESKSFATFSPLTYAIGASLANAHNGKEAMKDQEVLQSDVQKAREKTALFVKSRAALFNGVNLNNFLSGDWPQSQNVDKPHPFIAFKVQKAAASLLGGRDEPLKDMLVAFSEPITPDKLSLSSLPDESWRDYLSEVSKNIHSSKEPDELKGRIHKAHAAFRRRAEQYLWEQIGYAPAGDPDRSNSLLYDPVGTCYALNILLMSADAESADSGGPQRVLGEQVNLVSRSIQHILEAVTFSGLFPYGVPFSYSTNGMAGFATSINGLSALAHFLLKLLRRAREFDYPSEQFFERLLIDNFSYFEKLFQLPSLFANTRREVEITGDRCKFLKGAKRLHGWSTDRAPNDSRIESWVTIEVLLFAIYLREALQEYAQFIICQKYAAKLPKKDEPLWPYPAQATATKGKDFLIDPDDGEKNNDNCPVQFLHSKFNTFMTEEGRGGDVWTQEVSSVLLFGPPGAAKSTTVVSLAQKLGWHYLEMSPSNFIIDGLEAIEQKAKEIFEELGTLRETVILFDELDSLFVDRELLKPDSIINFLVPAMLPKMQRLSKRAKNQRLLIVIATNFYDRLDPAMVRRGRIDKHLLVLPYNVKSRLRTLEIILSKDKGLTGILEDGEFIKDFNGKSGLYVYEEIKALSKTIEKQSEEAPDKGPLWEYHFPASAINPSIYWSRIPRDEGEAASRIRSTQRLGLEVCEVTGRLLNEERNLSAESNLVSIIARLRGLESKLGSGEEHGSWKLLCEKVRSKLEPFIHNTPSEQDEVRSSPAESGLPLDKKG